jgi:probable HAF family extracellular repeat protein
MSFSRWVPLSLSAAVALTLVALPARPAPSMAVLMESTAVAPEFRVTDLGTLGGTTAYGLGVNRSAREVVGYSTTGATDSQGLEINHAFLWKDAQMFDLGTLGGSNSLAYGINDVGQVVGSSDTSDNGTVPFLWTPVQPQGTAGTMVALPALAPNGSSQAFAINASGRVCGLSTTAEQNFHAFMWTPDTANGSAGATLDLGTLPGDFLSSADSLNTAGVAAGSSIGNGKGQRVCLFRSGALTAGVPRVTEIGGFPSEAVSRQCAAIDDAGRVAGLFQVQGDRGFTFRPFLFDDTTRVLPLLLGGANGSAYGLMPRPPSAPVVVLGQSDGGRDPRLRASRWQGPAFACEDLNARIVRSPIFLTAAGGSNALGDIVCLGERNGEEHSFLLTREPLNIPPSAAFTRAPDRVHPGRNVRSHIVLTNATDQPLTGYTGKLALAPGERFSLAESLGAGSAAVRVTAGPGGVRLSFPTLGALQSAAVDIITVAPNAPGELTATLTLGTAKSGAVTLQAGTTSTDEVSANDVTWRVAITHAAAGKGKFRFTIKNTGTADIDAPLALVFDRMAGGTLVKPSGATVRNRMAGRPFIQLLAPGQVLQPGRSVSVTASVKLAPPTELTFTLSVLDGAGPP